MVSIDTVRIFKVSVRNISSTLLLSACLIFAACSPTTDQALSPDAAPPTVQEAGSKAAVAMPDRYGARVSEDILRAGGNAVGAARPIGPNPTVRGIGEKSPS